MSAKALILGCFNSRLLHFLCKHWETMSVSGATYFKTGYFVENIVNAVDSWFMIACSFGLQIDRAKNLWGKKSLIQQKALINLISDPYCVFGIRNTCRDTRAFDDKFSNSRIFELLHILLNLTCNNHVAYGIWKKMLGKCGNSELLASFYGRMNKSKRPLYIILHHFTKFAF